MPRRMLINAFHMNCVSHIQHGLWVRDDTRQLEYTQLDPWVELAQILEKGCFDALFLADVVGVYDTYHGGPETAIAEGMQIPVNDPALLISAMAHVTEHLGLAFTSSVLQTHPFTFAPTDVDAGSSYPWAGGMEHRDIISAECRSEPRPSRVTHTCRALRSRR